MMVRHGYGVVEDSDAIGVMGMVSRHGKFKYYR